MTSPLPETTPLITLPWIIRLRLGLAAAVASLVVFARFALRIELPWVQMLSISGVIALSNVFLNRRDLLLRRHNALSNSNLVALMFVLDIACLTGLLMLSGGPSNPFSLLYLVHVTLSATILTKRWTWCFGLLSTFSFGLLFVVHHPVPALQVHIHGASPNLHLLGMWTAFAVAASLVALFSGKIAELIRIHEASLRALQIEMARKDRLASLVTLAAGAAHELGSPLSTIAIVSKDLEIYAAQHLPGQPLAEDCKLIRAEVNRCQAILSNLSIQGAKPLGEASEWTDPARLLNDLEREFPELKPLRISVAENAAGAKLLLPARAVRQAIAALAKNALEASPTRDSVQVAARVEGHHVLLDVIDRGPGMSQDELRRVGEPFFTTKPPGKGMGLGVFLVRTLAEQIRAELTYRSSPSTGTTATLRLPLAVQKGVPDGY
jgi:two-component system sensor histidine kinase RegB